MRYEIRFHGRGGQGAKSASAILAEAALHSGMYIQSFPEYGAERQGAPMRAFNRFSDQEIRLHSGVTNPDMVVVMDETLLSTQPITEGLSNEGTLLVNTANDVEYVKKTVNYPGKIIVVNATQIAIDEIGRNNPNSAMLGAIHNAWDKIPLEKLKEEFQEKFKSKLPQEVIDKNLRAIERGAGETR